MSGYGTNLPVLGHSQYALHDPNGIVMSAVFRPVTLSLFIIQDSSNC